MTTSIILLNYNDAEATCAAIKRAERLKSIDSIVAADNASTDGSLQLLKTAAEECTKKTVLIETGRNGGYGFGNNTGVKYAAEALKADICIIANPDAFFSDELISEMLKVFEEKPDAGAVGAVMRLDGESRQTENKERHKSDSSDAQKYRRNYMSYEEFKRSGWCKRSFLGELAASAPILKRLFGSIINYSDAYYRENAPVIPVYAVHGSLLAVRTKAFEECGGYDEDMFLYMEEYALGARLEKAGFKTYLLSEYYRHEGSHSISGAGNNALKRQRFRQASERIYFKKYLGACRVKMLLLKTVQKIVLLETKMFVKG